MERRRQPRVPLRVPAQVDLGRQKVVGTVVDISEHGIALQVDAKITPESPVQVQFRLGANDAAEATLDAEIVEQRGTRSGTSVWGLRTIGTDLGTRTRLRGFVLRSLES